MSIEQPTRMAAPAPLPFVDLQAQHRRLKERIDTRLRAVLDHGQFILGPEVDELEAALARFSGAEAAVAVSSGTDALLIALLGLGVGPGDAVFVPAFTFPATAGAVVLAGATPVFVDVEPDSFNIDPERLAASVEQVVGHGALRARAVIPVDLFGLPADYAKICEIANAHGLGIIADAAQSFGSASAGVRVGQLAPITAISFFPSKPLGCFGDGGAVLTTDPDLGAVMRRLRVHGQLPDGAVERPGVNGRLDTLQAAVLLAKLEVFDDDLAARDAVARRYDRALGAAVTIPVRPADVTSAWANYSILVDNRDAFQAALKAEGIPTRIYYDRALHLHPGYEAFGNGPGSLPVAEDLARRIVSLPIFPDLDAATADRIAEAALRALG